MPEDSKKLDCSSESSEVVNRIEKSILRDRILSIEEAIERGARQESNSRTGIWAVLAVGVAFVGTAYGIVIVPIVQEETRLRTSVDAITQGYVTRPERLEMRDEIYARFAEEKANLERQLIDLDARIRILDQTKVSHADIDGLKIDLNARIIELNRRLGGAKR